jgi:hypothetical protein
MRLWKAAPCTLGAETTAFAKATQITAAAAFAGVINTDACPKKNKKENKK